MKNKLLLAILLALNVISVFGDYNQDIKEIDNSINTLQSNIDKYEIEKQNMVSKYDLYINDLKDEKETELQKLSWANNKMGVGNSSYAINSYDNLSNQYDSKIQALENEKNYNIGVYNDNINNLKSRISENEILKTKYYKFNELEQIDSKVKQYYNNKNYDAAIDECIRGLTISKQYNFNSSISFYENWIKDIQKTRDDIIKIENEKEKILKSKKTIEEATSYFEKGKEENIKGNFDKSIEYINQAILLLNDSNIDGGDNLINILKNYLISVEKSKTDKVQKENVEKQKLLEFQRKNDEQIKIDYQNKLKEKANIAFGKIKAIISKKPISKQSEIYKGLLSQLETIKTKVSQDKLIVVNELNRLILNELNNGGDEIGNILNEVLK